MKKNLIKYKINSNIINNKAHEKEHKIIKT